MEQEESSPLLALHCQVPSLWSTTQPSEPSTLPGQAGPSSEVWVPWACQLRWLPTLSWEPSLVRPDTPAAHCCSQRERATQQPLFFCVQSGGELPRPMDEELLPSSPPSSASLPFSARTFSPTTAPAPYRSGRLARAATVRLKVPLSQALIQMSRRLAALSTILIYAKTLRCLLGFPLLHQICSTVP